MAGIASKRMRRHGQIENQRLICHASKNDFGGPGDARHIWMSGYAADVDGLWRWPRAVQPQGV
jgi:hypothetical protein